MDRVDRLTDILCGAAMAGGVVGYGPLAKRVGMQPRHLTHLLASVSEDAVSRSEPMWSALCVSTLTEPKRPLEGFYGLARKLRPEYADLGDEELWKQERDRCYAAVGS